MNARSGSIAGFRLSLRRGLVPIRGSTQPLSAAGVDTDSQIQFDRNGRVLIVDQRGTANVLQTFVIGRHGAAEPPQTIPSAGGGTLRIRRRRARPHPALERLDRRLERRQLLRRLAPGRPD
jgi:hypothetical protein